MRRALRLRSRTCSTRRSPPASPTSGRRAPMTRCCQRCSRCAWPRARASPLGRAAAVRRAAPLRARGCRAPARAGPELERRLTALGRLEWAREECSPLEQSSDERDPEAIYARLPRVRNLSPAAPADRARARGLARAHGRPARPARAERPIRRRPGRDRKAQARIRPASWRRSAAPASVGSGRGAVRGARGGHSAAQRAPEEMPHEQRPPAPRPEDAPLIPLAEALLRARAREAGLAYELLATRSDLQAIVASHASGEEAHVRTLQGWRRELVGDELLGLLDGRVSLSAMPGAERAERRARRGFASSPSA